MLSVYQRGRGWYFCKRECLREHWPKLPRPALLQYDWNVWQNFTRAHESLGLTKQKPCYLLCNETVESEYEQQSSADGGDDEAELVQVFDWLSVRGPHWVPTITVCRERQDICDPSGSPQLHNSSQSFPKDRGSHLWNGMPKTLWVALWSS